MSGLEDWLKLNGFEVDLALCSGDWLGYSKGILPGWAVITEESGEQDCVKFSAYIEMQNKLADRAIVEFTRKKNSVLPSELDRLLNALLTLIPAIEIKLLK
jgi:hypothetical protein